LAEREKLGKARLLGCDNVLFSVPSADLLSTTHYKHINPSIFFALYAATHSIIMATIPVDPLQKVVVKLPPPAFSDIAKTSNDVSELSGVRELPID
jgi:hypothetical protein